MAKSDRKMLGITVLPEYFQVEGVTQVLDNCQDLAGANAITTSPYVMRIADQGEGQREPPIDAGAGDVRMLERPLWGKRELRVSTSPSFIPNRELYADTCYQPPVADEYTQRDGSVIETALAEMKSRGIRTFFQVQAAIPPGYRVQFSGLRSKDEPKLPWNKKVTNRVASNASLASSDVLNYQIALITDLFQQYPDVEGIRIDWPEYPPYKLDSVFLDFNSQVARFCDNDEAFDELRGLVDKAYQWCHGQLNTNTVIQMTNVEGLKQELRREGLLEGLQHWLQLKQDLVTNYICEIRKAMDSNGFREKLLVPHAFPPPFNKLSGINYSAIGAYSDHIPIKLYTMHWSMIARFYLDQLATANPLVEESTLVNAIFSLLKISDDIAPPRIIDVKYPGPDEPQLPTTETQKEKISIAQQEAGDTPIAALVHGYGPVDEFARRFETAYSSTQSFVWVNRYCYLGDEKLRVMGDLCNGK